MSDFNFPIVITSQGLQPQTPDSLKSQLLAAVAAVNPGYTGDLPGSLIEDIASTDVGAVVLSDQAKVELVNSLTPNAANEFLLAQLGEIYGTIQGVPTNTTVNVVFSGTVGFVIGAGFQVSDGQFTYQVIDGGVIATDGNSPSLTAAATTPGSFAVPADTVTDLVTSVPSAITLSVNNPVAGTPGSSGETAQSYRSRVMQTGLASAQGMPRFIKSQISNVSGVVPRLVAVSPVLGTGVKVICGGGDNYEVANAIFRSVLDPATLVASSTTARNVTVSINDYPDTYSIVYVDPPEQVLTITVTWNTSLSGFTQGAAVSQAAVQPIADYLNSIPVGAPINLLELNQTFLSAISSILDADLVNKLDYAVTINGTAAPPVSGEQIIESDSESYFSILNTAITITQG